MNRELVDKIVNAVLYEGYILYPYRASSKKNQRERFTFGRIYPQEYSDAQNGREPSLIQTECLVCNESHDAALEISVRFLQPLAREVCTGNRSGCRDNRCVRATAGLAGGNRARSETLAGPIERAHQTGA